MVIAGEVQHAVQDQDLQFVGGAVAVAAGVFASDVGGNGDVTACGAREGEHVSRLVLAAEAAVELLQARVAGDQDIHFAGNPRQLLRPPGKALSSAALTPLTRFPK